MQAHDFLGNALQHMQDRATIYDAEGGERSIERTVQLFNILTGVEITPEEGWLFMVCLKLVRSQQGGFRADSYEDGAAYFALAGEAAHKRRRTEGQA